MGHFGPILTPFWAIFGPILDPLLAQSRRAPVIFGLKTGPRNGPKMGPKWAHLGTPLEPPPGSNLSFPVENDQIWGSPEGPNMEIVEEILIFLVAPKALQLPGRGATRDRLSDW